MSTMKIVFFGTSSFAANILCFLLEKKIDVCAIVTQTDKKTGKRVHVSPVKDVALSKPQIKLFQPEKATDEGFISEIKDLKPDLFVVVAYGKILRPKLLDVPKVDSINVHASLLPKYRGADPIRRCIMEGEKETGISIMKMVAEMDAGDIIEMEKIPISIDDNFEIVEKKLCQTAKELLLSVLHQFEKKTVKYKPQDHTKATFANKLTKEEMEISWNQSALHIHNLIRALSPYPGATCDIYINGEKKRLKILESEIIKKQAPFGEIISFENDTWIVGCKENCIKILSSQLEGKKRLSTGEFIRGIKGKVSFHSSI